MRTNIKTKDRFLPFLRRLFFWLGAFYLSLSVGVLIIHGPWETTWLGIKVSLTSLINPIRISLSLLFLSFLAWRLGTNRRRETVSEKLSKAWQNLQTGGITTAHRISWIDNLRALAIFLMVFGHTSNSAAFIGGLIMYIYSFHMPLFFFISGLTFSPKKYRSLKEILVKKSTTLLFPYFFFSLIGYGLFLITQHQYYSLPKLGDAVYRIIYADTDLLAFAHDGPLWFLPCLFLVEIEFWIISFLKKGRQIVIIVLLTALGFIWGPHFRYIPWSAAVSLVGLFFFGLGFLVKNGIFSLNNYAKKLSIVWGIGLSLLFCYLNGPVGMAIDQYGNPLYFLLSALGGIIYIVFLITYSSPNKLLTIIGMNTIIILGLHGDLLFFILPISEPVIHLTAFSSIIPLTQFHWLNTIIDLLNRVLFSFLVTLIQIGFIYLLIPLFNLKLYFLLGRRKTGHPLTAGTENSC